MTSEVDRLHSHAWTLAARFQQGGESNWIDEAIDLARQALDLCPAGHPMRSVALGVLAFHLSTRYDRVGGINNLDEAITVGREALLLCPSGHLDRSIRLNNLGFYLSTRYNKLGGIDDLNEAVELGREALLLCPPGHSDRSMRLNNLGARLSIRYERLGEIGDLEEAVTLGREALLLCPSGHADRSMRLNNLGARLSIRYERLGGIHDLDEAVTLGREALPLCPTGHPDRSMRLDNLGSRLSTRYNQLGGIDDLEEAVTLGREALLLCPPGHPDRSVRLNNLGTRLSTRYHQLGGIDDLEEAVTMGREALFLCPSGHPNRSMRLDNLGARLSTRYHRLGGIDDLEEAVTMGREALLLCPLGHPDRPMRLNNLGARLSIRYDRFGAPEDLNEAIMLGREVLVLCPLGHPLRASSLNYLADRLRTRFTKLREEVDKEELFGLYIQLADLPQITTFSDLSAGRAWIETAEEFQHSTTLLAYQTTLRWLIHHLTTLPSLPQHLPNVKKLTSTLAADAFSACLRNHAPTNAVELLEQGRGVFWSQLTRLHSGLDDVVTSGSVGKRLAEKFTHLTSLIRDAIHSPGPDQHNQVCSLNVELQRVVTEIRQLPGFSRFLLPSLFSDLQQAASGGPVIVVNASKYGCDALIVFVDRDPVHVPLSVVSQKDVQDMSSKLRTLTLRAKRMDMTKELKTFLRKLWDDVVSPIVDVLRKTQPLKTRIWWCPTSEFTFLPLHTAGPFRKGQRNLPELYISSYTPTLNALARARRDIISNVQRPKKSIVAIGHANAAGESELLTVGAELANLSQLVDSLATFTRLEGPESCILRVTEELGQSEWAHFACHGIPNEKKPFDSAFALHDGRLTIQRIIRCELENPEFAYLSACHTTVGDEESPDEAIHLAAAMQFVGFRSVIGTMWAVDDAETIKVTSTFYKYLVGKLGHLDYTRAAFALNRTMRELKDIPFDQRILYVHLGA